MLRRPDADEVMEYGRALGFDLTPLEALTPWVTVLPTVLAVSAAFVRPRRS